MYYYVLESPSSRAVRQTYQKLRDILTNLGIAGEMVTASPARTPTELTQMGVSKGYSTIVAVGGDDHIDEVAIAALGQAVLGVVPINASGLVTELVGVRDLRDAAESLKRRRLTTHSVVFVEPDNAFFLDAVVNAPKLAKISLVLDNKVRVHSYFNTLTINRALELHLTSEHITEPKKILGLFSTGGKKVTSESFFHPRQVRIITEPPLPLMVGSTKVALTPTELRLVPESLKVITKRGTVLE
ncbi:MAG: diacylglycerol kinase family protein [Patescibacteria group bacterium]